MVRHDSPSPEYYEPFDLLDDDELEPDPRHPELLTLRDGAVWWSAAEID